MDTFFLFILQSIAVIARVAYSVLVGIHNPHPTSQSSSFEYVYEYI